MLRASRALIAGAALLSASPSPAQYQVYQWLNFEDGTVPASAILIGKEPERTVQVLKLGEVPGMPPEFHNREAAKETGRFGLLLKAAPDPADWDRVNTGLIASDILDRDRIGQGGRAVYQADFFIPAEGEIPSLAVVAMDPPKAPQGRVVNPATAFYRFGLTLGKTVYFSYIKPGQKNAVVYHGDANFLAQIPRPGWHRFAIVMEGADTIRCYVDGREPSFSPIREPELRKLMVGVMLAESKRTYDAYVDNLSIQVSEDAPSLPESPYMAGWKKGAAASAQGSAARSTTPPPSLAQLTEAGWLEPVEAWEKAKRENKPLLLYFFAPGIPGTVRMDEIFATNTKAAEFVRKHSSARVDINQLQGGSIAKQYEVYKVPMLLVISPDAKSYKRAVMSADDTWESLSSQLTLP